MSTHHYMNIIFSTLFLLLIGYGIWVYRRLPKKNPPGRRVCTEKAALEYRCQLEQMRVREEWKAKNLSGMAQERASWLEAKIGYVLMKTGGKDAIHDPNMRNMLEDMYLLIMRARHQALLSSEKMLEEWGGRLRTYVSPIDGSLRTYSVSLPGGYDPTVRWPLIVSMHGHGWYGKYQGHPAPYYSGAVCLSPEGRGSSDYKNLGEEDVLATIDLVMKEFSIDSERVYLTGSSMGGTGSFHLGVHYADRFAGIFPIVGNADNLAWTERWGWNHEFAGRNNELRNLIQESHTARAFVGNLFNLPTYILAGSADDIVPPAHSRNMVAEMRQLGMNMEYREYPGVGHGGFPGDAMQSGLAWICSWKRNPYPKAVHWKADLLKHGKAYWVRIDQFDVPLTLGGIDAVAKTETMVNIHTTNLLAFSIQRPTALFEEGEPLMLVIDGTRLTLPPTDDENAWTMLRKDPNHGWMLASDIPLEPLQKKVGCEGPVAEALLNPFVLVIGTQNEKMNEAWKREAEYFAREWESRYHSYPRMVNDSDVDEEIEQEYNLILFGGSSDNEVSARQINIPWDDMRALLTSKIYETNAEQTEEEEAEDVQNKKDVSEIMDRADMGTIVVYPSEGNLDRLAVVWTANSPAAAYQGWWRFGNWFNWGVFDSKKYFDYAIYDARSCNPETMLLVGWFGSDWQVPTGRYYFANEEVRKESADQVYPEYDQVPDMKEFPLISLRPKKIRQMRGAVGFGRTFFGEPLENGLGMRAPCTIEYNVDGKCATFASGVTLLNPRESAMCSIRERGESVKFKVFGDGKLIKELKVDWKKPKDTLNVKISGVKILKLEAVPDGGPSWLHMGSAWLNPTLGKSEP
ncbi:MAG: prolyl oligopeptidase family serine peptidase [Victivallales bacterium]|nr:prolyl oligopeptidase family serine peptidase [Victivallales bacterium]